MWSGSFVVEGDGAVRGDGGRSGEPRGATDGDRARVPSRALAARARQRPAAALADRALGAARGRAHRLGLCARRTAAAARVQFLTAGIVNLVPEGLILLISLTAAVSAFKMAQRGVLAQQLNAVESLASVDLVCTDKTGTLTEPTLRVVGLVPADGVDEAALARALAELRRQRPVAQLDAAGDRGRPAGGRRASAASSLRCRSPRGGAGARSTSATSGSCSGRRSGSPPPTPRSPSERARRGERGAARAGARALRGAAARGRLRAAVPRRRAARSAWSCSPSGCGRTRPRRSPSSPRRTSSSRCSPATRRPPSGAIARDAGVPGIGARRSTARRCRPSRRRCARRSCPRPPSGASRPEGKRAVVDALAGRRSLRGDGRRRGQRRARAQGGAPRDRAGLRGADGALGRRPRARARRLRRRARDGRRGAPDPAQHPARRAAVRDQVGIQRPSWGWRSRSRPRPSRCCRASSRSPRRSRSASPRSCSRSRRAPARGGRSGSSSRSRGSRSRPAWRSGSGSSPATFSPATASTSA